MSLAPEQQSHLLGIILAVHSTTAGNQMVFRYPPVERNHLSEEMEEHLRSESTGKNKIAENCPKNPNDPPIIYVPHTTYSAYNIPSLVLSSILCPRLALCDQIVEFMVDDAKFIGRPTILSTPKPSQTCQENVSNVDTVTSLSNSSNQSIEQNVATDINTKTNILSKSPTNVINNNISVQSDRAQTTSTNSNLRQSQIIPNAISTEHQESTSELNGSVRKNKEEITMFNFMLVVEKKTKRSLTKMCYHIVSQVASALKHEEQRCGYLTTEVTKMLKVRERWLVKQSLSEDLRPDHQALTYDLLQESHLARVIKDIFHALREEGTIQCKINDWITLSLCLKDFDEYSPIQIRPYQTLLILDPPELRKSLLPDSSPSLRKLIEVARPTKSFRELSVETGIPLTQLYRLAMHLVYWNKARIINTLAKTNVYILNPNPKCSDFYFPFIGQKFSRVFPAFRLPEVLESFSIPKKLGEHVLSLAPSLQKEFVEVVIWLLRHDLIIQLHTFVFFVIPESDDTPQLPQSHNTHPILINNNDKNNNNSVNFVQKTVNNLESCIEEGANDVPTENQQQQQERNLLSPSELSPREKQYLEKINDGSVEYQLLVRLCPYFRGYHHLEEIMWRENVTREDLAKVLVKYKDILILCHHEGYENTSE